MTFFVLDANPVKSANLLYWLDAESAAFDGARIIVSAYEQHGNEVDDLPFKPMKHPLVRWAVVSAENARWLYRYTRAALIKVGEGEAMDSAWMDKMHTDLNAIAASLDERLPRGQQNLFGNFYVDDRIDTILSQESIESNLVWYEATREHLRWADQVPHFYDGGEEE